jgi:uroporphyrinogen-III synthase
MSLPRKLVVVTRSLAGNKAWSDYLSTHGIRVYRLPTIETTPITKTTLTLKQLISADWLVITSAASVQYMQTLAAKLQINLSTLTVRVAAIGEQTAKAAERAGLQVTFMPSHPGSVYLGQEITPISGMHVLLSQATIASDELGEVLRSRGALVTKLPLYETRTIDTLDKKFAMLLQDNLIGYFVFASPSGVQGFHKRISIQSAQTAHGIPAIAIGPEVAQTLTTAGFTTVYVSKTPSIESIFETLNQLSDRE